LSDRDGRGRVPLVREPLWYFAYGSNMCAAIFEERRGMRPSARACGWIDGHRLCFDLPVGPGERGVANLVAENGARMHGVVYQLTADECENLDRSEGVLAGYYNRALVVVITANGERIEAFTYQSPHGSPGRKPSQRYMGLLLDGAREHGLPDEYV